MYSIFHKKNDAMNLIYNWPHNCYVNIYMPHIVYIVYFPTQISFYSATCKNLIQPSLKLCYSNSSNKSRFQHEATMSLNNAHHFFIYNNVAIYKDIIEEEKLSRLWFFSAHLCENTFSYQHSARNEQRL